MDSLGYLSLAITKIQNISNETIERLDWHAIFHLQKNLKKVQRDYVQTFLNEKYGIVEFVGEESSDNISVFKHGKQRIEVVDKRIGEFLRKPYTTEQGPYSRFFIKTKEG